MIFRGLPSLHQFVFDSLVSGATVTVADLTGKAVEITVDHQTTVAELKQKLEVARDQQLESQALLTFAGKDMEDHRTLFHYLVPGGGTIHLVTNQPSSVCIPLRPLSEKKCKEQNEDKFEIDKYIKKRAMRTQYEQKYGLGGATTNSVSMGEQQACGGDGAADHAGKLAAQRGAFNDAVEATERATTRMWSVCEQTGIPPPLSATGVAANLYQLVYNIHNDESRFQQLHPPLADPFGFLAPKIKIVQGRTGAAARSSSVPHRKGRRYNQI